MFSDEDRKIERSRGGVRRERELSKKSNPKIAIHIQHFFTLDFMEELQQLSST